VKPDYRAAIRLQQRALTVLPGGKSSDIDRMRALTEIGLNEQALGQPEQAIAFLREALALSERAQTHTSRARAEILAGLNRSMLTARWHSRQRPTADSLPAVHARSSHPAPVA
jgi:hypothetical protein